MTNTTFGALPPVSPLRVTADTFADGDRLPDLQVSRMASERGGDRSPALTWAPGPDGTASYAVTCYDPDAPTGSGFWHWAVFGLPADTLSLPEDAGAVGALEARFETARTLANDGGVRGYIGAAPPPGHGDHHYVFAVHALDLAPEEIELPDTASPALLGFTMFGHTLARGLVTATWGH